MNLYFYIIGCVIILFILCIFFKNKNGIKEKFVGLSRFNPDNPEFYEMKDEWGEDIDIDEYENDENTTTYIKKVDFTPKIPNNFTTIKSFDKMINIEDYISENNKKCSKGEIICKLTLEKIYNVPFKNIRPDFLKNPETNHNLELDCYNEDLKIAVEYNGAQHYKWPNKYHDKIEDFYKQVKHDEIKRDLCKINDIHLIEVPYIIPLKNIPSYILINLPNSFDDD